MNQSRNKLLVFHSSIPHIAMKLPLRRLFALSQSVHKSRNTSTFAGIWESPKIPNAKQ